MPDQRKWEAYWSSLSVEERIRQIENREVHPSLQKMSDDIAKRRESGKDRPVYDLVPSFIAAYKDARSERSLHKRGSDEANAAHFAMQNVRLSAQQQLSRKDYERFREGIK